MSLNILRFLESRKKAEEKLKSTINHPIECPDCGGWIEFKSNTFGRFYVCKHCKWSCTGELL